MLTVAIDVHMAHADKGALVSGALGSGALLMLLGAIIEALRYRGRTARAAG